MSYFEIRQRIQQACKLGGWSNVDPPPQFDVIANRGYREFVRATSGNVENVLISTVANQISYATTTPADTRAWISFWDDALYNYVVGQPGSGWYLPQITQSKLRWRDIQYRDSTVSQPEVWYYDKGNTNTIALYPPPNLNNVVMSFNGIRELPPMVNDDDVTPFSEIYDEAIADFGIWWFAKQYTRGNERQVAKEYLLEAEQLVNQFKAEQVSAESTLINRRVALPPQDYVSTGTRQPVVWPNGYGGPVVPGT